MILQNIVNIAQICARHQVQDIVLSPGSRCAPLTLAFVRHPELVTKTISDERAAAFIALGMAQKSKQATALCCTSGSAAYNYAPAVAEAFFQQIPLIIFTADRPPEWIDQLDGQTIRQQEIYGKHVKGSFQLPVKAETKEDLWYSDRIVSQAINLATTYPQGPVHINVPVREPFYPEQDEAYDFNFPVKVIEQWQPDNQLQEQQWQSLLSDWHSFERKLIVGGQQDADQQLNTLMAEFTKEFDIPVLGDIISNQHANEKNIRHQDIFLGVNEGKESLRPELLITFGRSVISKNLKLFLRKYRPKAHWHIQAAGEAADTFQALSRVIPMEPKAFFRGLLSRQSPHKKATAYLENWQQKERQAAQFSREYTTQQKEFNEFSAVQRILDQLPENSDLHLANSMSVRYANFVGLQTEQKNIEVYANRGTSGIDGSNSTAVGHALKTNKLTTLITGDLAFFYDRNGLWHNYLPDNLRIVLLNNHAGGIFGMINGPGRQPELEEYFETRQQLNAQRTANDFEMDYLYCSTFEHIDQQIDELFRKDGQAKLLEVETNKVVNQAIFKQFKQQINKYYGK